QAQRTSGTNGRRLRGARRSRMPEKILACARSQRVGEIRTRALVLKVQNVNVAFSTVVLKCKEFSFYHRGGKMQKTSKTQPILNHARDETLIISEIASPISRACCRLVHPSSACGSSARTWVISQETPAASISTVTAISPDRSRCR